jgi:hypothetical protein
MPEPRQRPGRQTILKRPIPTQRSTFKTYHVARVGSSRDVGLARERRAPDGMLAGDYYRVRERGLARDVIRRMLRRAPLHARTVRRRAWDVQVGQSAHSAAGLCALSAAVTRLLSSPKTLDLPQHTAARAVPIAHWDSGSTSMVVRSHIRSWARTAGTPRSYPVTCTRRAVAMPPTSPIRICPCAQTSRPRHDGSCIA